MPRRRLSSPVAREADGDLRREQARLRRAFTAILVAVAPTALAQGCDRTTAPAVGTGGEASIDAGVDRDATAHETSDDASADGDAQADDADAQELQDAALDCNGELALYDSGADAEEGCTITLACGLPVGLTAVGCDLYAGGQPFGCSLAPDAGCSADAYAPPADGVVVVVCPVCPGGGGRRPHGLRAPRAIRTASWVGGWYARMAHDEAASVHAFRRLGAELASFGAPASLRRAAERAACDEVRHARAMARLARRHGASPPRPRVRRARPRTLDRMARENAVEGCVHETFGALLAAWQSVHAPTAALRRTFTRIAADETRHAALAWSVARWCATRLDARALARVLAARARAVRRLRSSVEAWPCDASVGRPSARDRARLVQALVRALDLGPELRG